MLFSDFLNFLLCSFSAIWDISKEIYLKHGSRKRLRKNISNKKIVSKEKEIQYELKLDF